MKEFLSMTGFGILFLTSMAAVVWAATALSDRNHPLWVLVLFITYASAIGSLLNVLDGGE